MLVMFGRNTLGLLIEGRWEFKAPAYTCAGASDIIGLEAAGEVAEVGEGVTGFKKGERVMTLLDGGG